jgi:tRNA pseudouridine55 synthase
MNGLIIIDKPAGPTSAEVVRQLKKLLGRRTRVGHLGTLDPFATGVLPILIGEGTKLAPFLQEGSREYAGLIQLGIETDTLDSTGQISRVAPVPNLDADRIAAIAEQFTGRIEQTPPIFSAIKRSGVPLYKLARQGIEVEPPAPRAVSIERLELEIINNDSIGFNLVCSPGMYVRSLARDIGLALDTAAHLSELRRIRSGAFSVADAHRLDQVITALERGEAPGLISMRGALAALPEVVIDPMREGRIRHGDSRALDGPGPEVTPAFPLAPQSGEETDRGGLFKVISRGELVAIARTTSRLTAVIARVFGNRSEECA